MDVPDAHPATGGAEPALQFTRFQWNKIREGRRTGKKSR